MFKLEQELLQIAIPEKEYKETVNKAKALFKAAENALEVGYNVFVSR